MSCGQKGAGGGREGGGGRGGGCRGGWAVTAPGFAISLPDHENTLTLTGGDGCAAMNVPKPTALFTPR